MQISDEELRKAIKQTEILRHPKQSLATFGITVVNYYMLSAPVYEEANKNEETVIREGKVSAERPRIVTPFFLSRLEGFSENAKRYMEFVMRHLGPHAPGLLYSYKNESGQLSIVSDRLDLVAGRLTENIDKSGDKLSAIIKGVDELWDISLIKFISDLTENSLKSNLLDLNQRGLLKVDRTGVPDEARLRIEELFQEVAMGESDPSNLKKEIDRWDLFGEYEDRFLNLFRKKYR